MSLYGALYAAVSGLAAQANKLGIISDAVANVNTVGYKQSIASFETLVTSSGGVTAYSPGGVLGRSQQLVSTQGLLQTTSSPTDVAISGGGFFVTNSKSDGSGQVLYTRAGSFTQDSQGNFRNAAGLFLQAWPLDRDGRLPGETGNLNTISSANLSSLETVNVQDVTGTAAASTSVSLGANLKSSQAAYTGAGATAVLDDQDTANFGIKASDIIIPTTVDSIVRGDSFTVGISGSTYTYTYGGFTFGRNVVSAANGDSGVSLLSSPTTLNNTALTVGAGGFDVRTTGASPVVRVTVASTTNLRAGDYITIAGETATINGLAPGSLNGTYLITSIVDGTHFEYTSPGTSTGTGTGGNGATATPGIFRTTNASNTVTVTHLSHGLSTGAVVTFSGISAALAGIPASELNESFVVTVVDSDHYTITTPTTAATSTTGGGSGTVSAETRPFAGNILDAVNTTQAFLGTTGISAFTTDALTFTIPTAASGTKTFTYTPTAPNTQLQQFNNLTNLAQAISAVEGMTARVVNNRLYVGASDANATMTFANGEATGDSGPPVLSGINWIRELGLADVSTTGTARFSSLASLDDAVNLSTGLSATTSNPLSESSVEITVDDPLDTITFTDSSGNTGSLLAALGLVDSLNGGAFSVQTTGALGPSYDPSDSEKNMASGAISSPFTRPVTVFDAQGSPHSLNVAFLKVSTNTWAVEIYSQPETDVDSSLPDGQIAVGTIEFNGDGSLKTVSETLTDAIPVNWTNGAELSSLVFNWGTQGDPFGTPGATEIGLTDGLSQFDSSYNVNFVKQNGAPVGKLTSVSIDENGFISASYSNGQTQAIYKIPLASFTNPDGLQAVSGNAFTQASASGEVNLKQAGQSGVGKFASGALEASNVELAAKLTDMIVAQRAYQANTKVISTADELLGALDRILS